MSSIQIGYFILDLHQLAIGQSQQIWVLLLQIGE
jgi:hypothetical protein